MTPARKPQSPAGFTLLEVLIVIGIIVLLVSILLPVVSTVQLKARVTQTQAQMAKLQQAIMNYYHDWNAYPGPLANNQLVGNTPPAGQQVVTVGLAGIPVNSSENLALGLLGYIDPNYTAGQVPPPTRLAMGPPSQIPPGPPRPPTHDVLNLSTPKTYHYIDFVASEVSVGYWLGGLNQARVTDTSTTGVIAGEPGSHTISDTLVPEFVDQITTGIGPMPIIYVRANAGINGNAGRQGIDYDAHQSPTTPLAQYDVAQFLPYGFTTVDTSDFPTPVNTPGATQWTGYLANSNIANAPRGKDGFLLISAGGDRKWGTADDIIVTP